MPLRQVVEHGPMPTALMDGLCIFTAESVGPARPFSAHLLQNTVWSITLHHKQTHCLEETGLLNTFLATQTSVMEQSWRPVALHHALQHVSAGYGTIE